MESQQPSRRILTYFHKPPILNREHTGRTTNESVETILDLPDANGAHGSTEWVRGPQARWKRRQNRSQGAHQTYQ